MDIFKERKNVQPYEYPELLDFTKAIFSAFWYSDHFTYKRDIKDFKTALNDNERQVIESSVLAIGIVESKVKDFWANIHNRMPKTEISDVGFVFAGNEVVHRQTYSRLLEDLGLAEKFKDILEIPCMGNRVKYLKKYLVGVNSRSNKEFTKSLILFTLLVENCSLFSQFLIVSSFSKYKNLLKNFSKVINATAREEIIHGKFGSTLVNIIKSENPDWFDDEMENKIRRAIRKAFKAECDVLDWIFRSGELDFISKKEIIEFLKIRLNDSLNQIGYSDEYIIDKDLARKSEFMETMLLATKSFDFFDGKSSDYNLNKSFTKDAIWEI